jgi:hypothetical protein
MAMRGRKDRIKDEEDKIEGRKKERKKERKERKREEEPFTSWLWLASKNTNSDSLSLFSGIL